MAAPAAKPVPLLENGSADYSQGDQVPGVLGESTDEENRVPVVKGDGHK
jgi:hypothetical protein